jgi:hypothetical protein
MESNANGSTVEFSLFTCSPFCTYCVLFPRSLQLFSVIILRIWLEYGENLCYARLTLGIWLDDITVFTRHLRIPLLGYGLTF